MSVSAQELDTRAFGLACGLLWSGGVVLLGLTARVGWGRRWQRLLADVYRGYDESVPGLLVGALWAFVDGFSGGYSLAWLYDRLQRQTEAPAMPTEGEEAASVTGIPQRPE